MNPRQAACPRHRQPRHHGRQQHLGRAIRAWLAMAALLTGPASNAVAAPLVFDLDPEHSFVQFEVSHFDTSTLRGRFGPLQGEVQLDAAAGRGRVGLVIDTRTLDTGLKLLDARLRQADLLDVAAHPQAFFVAERFRFDGDRPVELTGEFTLRGRASALTLRALRFACSPTVPRRCGGDFEGELRRSDHGADFGLPLVGDLVRLRVQVEALQRP